MITEADYNWIKNNLSIFNNIKLTVEQKERMFQIYNTVSNVTMKPTSCGRCVSNVKKKLKIEYDRYENLS